MGDIAITDESASRIDSYLNRKTIWIPSRSRSITRVSIFDIPSLVLRQLMPIPIPDEHKNGPLSEKLTFATTITISGSHGLTCRCCGITFPGVVDQKEHFKSEQHVFNLKRSIGSGSKSSSVTSDSLSDLERANDTASSDSDNEDSRETEEEYLDKESFSNLITSIGDIKKTYTSYYGSQYIISSQASSKWKFAVSSAIVDLSQLRSQSEIPDLRQASDSAAELPWLHLFRTISLYQDQRIWGILILRSGKFAGGLFDGNSVIVHKIFRRYTIRAKAGGSQSSHDNKGGKAKSAGAMMRRAGEQALKEEIKQLIRDWSAYFQTCSLILLSVPKTMRSVVFDDAKDYPLQKDDPRIRTVPFMVDTPTFENVKRIHSICSTLTFSSRDTPDADIVGNDADVLSESKLEGLEATESSEERSENNSKMKSSNAVDEIATKVESIILNCQESRELIEACVNGRNEIVRAMINKYSVAGSKVVQGDDDSDDEVVRSDIPSVPAVDENSENIHLIDFINLPESVDEWKTPLHIAAELGHATIVGYLLQGGANPTIKDVRGRTAHILAKDKETRDSFRRYRGSSEEAEQQWPWEDLGVGPALTEDAERLRKEKEKEKKKRAKAKKKEQKEKDDLAAKELVERQKVEAKQAEEQRAQRLQLLKDSAGNCGFCGVSLYGVKALDVFDRRCCSSECVVKLRRRLAAEAAEKRFAK